jgi:hypothetical protein
MSFSQRQKLVPTRTVLQLNAIDGPLRNGLWNAFHISVGETIKVHHIDTPSAERTFFQIIWHHFFKATIDAVPAYVPQAIQVIRKWFFEAEWFQVYDFLEFVGDQLIEIEGNERESFRDFCNTVLATELSGYRFVGDKIVPLSNATEIAEIEFALNAATQNSLAGAGEHLTCAIEKFADRQQPDYRNCIKEAISAIESISRQISADPKAELGTALKVLGDKVGLHPALKKGFLAIYGYTSDEGGIRHSLLDESVITPDDARFMLVACSAFFNYLVAKANNAGISLK